MPKLYSYVRFSSPEQRSGDSLRRQRQQSADYAARHGLTLDESLTLEDLGVSAFKGRNVKEGALGAFLEAVRAGKVEKGSILAVENLDRLTRDTMTNAISLFLNIINAGLTLVTFHPVPMTYTKEAIDENPSLVQMAVNGLFLANLESKNKSERIGQSWDSKRSRIDKQKITGIAPAWLTLSADKTRFEVKKESAKWVRQMFKWSSEGMGVVLITKRLNNAGISDFGNRSKTGFDQSYVKKILHNRAVIGEFTPHKAINGKRQPVGDPLLNYYPAIISESLFYKVQQALASRRNQRGPIGKKCANLFTGLICDANDGTPLTITYKDRERDIPRVVSSGAVRRMPGSVYKTFPYRELEFAILSAVKELKGSDFAPVEQEEEDRESTVSGQLAGVDDAISQTEERIALDPSKAEHFLNALSKLGAKRDQLRAELETVKASKSTKHAETLEETQSLLSLLHKAPQQERMALRQRIKSKLRLLVERIDVSIEDDATYKRGNRGKRSATFVITYRNWTARAGRVWGDGRTLLMKDANLAEVAELIKADK